MPIGKYAGATADQIWTYVTRELSHRFLAELAALVSDAEVTVADQVDTTWYTMKTSVWFFAQRSIRVDWQGRDSYTDPVTGIVRVILYNVRGEVVATSGNYATTSTYAWYSHVFDGIPAGLYHIVLQSSRTSGAVTAGQLTAVRNFRIT